MNVTQFPKVRDLTDRNRRMPIEIDGSPVYDLLLTIWSAFDDEDHAGFELGGDWFDQIAAATPDDLAEELTFIAGPDGCGWLALVGLIASSPYPHDIDTVLKELSGMAPTALRRGLLGHKVADQAAMEGESAAAAVSGDEDALAEILADKPQVSDHFAKIFSLPQSELRDRIVAAIGRFRTELYAEFEADFGQAVLRAASARKALVRGADPEAVIEDVTNGLDYRIQAGISRLVLVPSVVLRPWAIIDRHRDTLVVVYPVADEFIDADPDAPPSWLVKLHKALADERRLRILRRLSEGPASLDDLVGLLGLTKSTVHHHVGLLRGAGLVRVTMDKTYSLRPGVLPEAFDTLDDYLRSDSDVRPLANRSEK